MLVRFEGCSRRAWPLLKLLLIITVSGVLLIVLVATFIPALPLLIVEAGPGPPLGEIGGLHYVWWDFGTDNFESPRIYVTIYNEPDNDDGLYFQMYQGRINDVGFYFGLQTRLSNPNTGVTAKGLIFSRWETRDLSNVRPAEGGWSQSAGYEGDFVGIRKHYEWTNHSYQLKIAYVESDEVGDWYGVWIYDLDNSGQDYLSSIRFPSIEPSEWGIENGWVTWTELYSKGIQQTPIPNWHVSIDGIYASEQMIPALSGTSAYSDIGHTDIYYEESTKRIHFLMGPEVVREHAPGTIWLSWTPPANQPPIALFTYSPENPAANEDVTFDASESYNPDGEVVSYEWNFGDGNTSSGKVVTHTYSTVGDYAVTLIVTDNDGALSAYSRAIMVGGAVRKGDFDGDGDIDFFDFVAFAACYGSILGSANYNVIGDFDEDGYVDLYDFVDFAAVYGT